jgi:hypothetical protein
MKVKKIKNKIGFFCPGCKFLHMVDDKWDFNNNYNKPTIKPSILVQGHRDGKDFKCHSFVTDGKIRFLNDCTHKLAGKKVKLNNF